MWLEGSDGDVKFSTRTPLFPLSNYRGDFDHIPAKWQGLAYSELEIDGFINAFDGLISKDQLPVCSVACSTYHLPVLQTFDWGVSSDFDPEKGTMTVINNTEQYMREIELVCHARTLVQGQAIDDDSATKNYEITAKYASISFVNKLLKPGATFVKEDLPYRHCEVDSVEKINPKDIN